VVLVRHRASHGQTLVQSLRVDVAHVQRCDMLADIFAIRRFSKTMPEQDCDKLGPFPSSAIGLLFRRLLLVSRLRTLSFPV
jgi:hypothetical protein